MASRLRDEGARAFGKLKARLGSYPYPTLRVVQSAGGYAMESPALVWLPYGLDASRYRYLVTHEVAHQWFYGLVGSNQIYGWQVVTGGAIITMAVPVLVFVTLQRYFIRGMVMTGIQGR